MNLLLLLLCAIQVAVGEWRYYHERSKQTFKPPVALQEDSYFGFSSTYDRYNKRLIISSPNEDDIGEVYECELTRKPCLKLKVNITKDPDVHLYKHHFWFGATLKAGPSFVVACAPRYARAPTHYKAAGTYGRCYTRDRNTGIFDAPLAPLLGYPGKDKPQEYTMDTLGWALDISDDGSMIVGGPGLFNKKGIAVIRQRKILKPIVTIDQEIHNNFGYSVAIGYFTNTDAKCYAVSTTYGTAGAGQVYFYTDYNDKYPMKLHKGKDNSKQTDPMIGSMFGAVLCAAKMNALGVGDDLLVGAPTYALNSGYNTGAVYVYYYTTQGSPPTYHRTIVGQKSASLFGSAIISVADLNGDGKDEIAIGAPYEDSGAVYLYSGAVLMSKETTITWLQKIVPSGNSLRSFGYSLAALRDYDENGCNEIAISAPFNDTVILYKCLAAVTITNSSAIFPNVKDRSKTRQKDFVFQVCLDVKFPEKPKNVIGELLTEVKMIHEYAKLKNPNINDTYTFKTQLQSKNKTYCQNVDFTLPLDKDYGTEISYTITTNLQKSPMDMDNVNGDHVVLSDDSKLAYTGSFWAAECAGIRECVPNLSMTITDDLIERPLIIGSRADMNFNIHILNTGEVAYDPCVHFKILGTTLQKPPMYCSEDKHQETFKCSSIKPVKTNETWKIENIAVELTSLTNQDKEISVQVQLVDRCDHTDPKSAVRSIPLRSSSAGVTIKGTTDVGDPFGITKHDLPSPKHFEQIYTILNNGPTGFKLLTSTVKVQKTKFVTYSEAPVSIYIDATSKTEAVHRTCPVETSTDVEVTANCEIDSLFKNNHVKVVIAMNTNPDFLTYDILKTENNIKVISSLTVKFEEDKPKSFSITTQIQLREAFVDPWIIVVACLVGLLLIVIIAVVLYKYGFFQRKNKEQLESLKREIKRQSMRRSMVQPNTDERNQILENMQEGDESIVPDVLADHKK